MKRHHFLLPFLLFGLQACSDPTSAPVADDPAALAAASEVVTSLTAAATIEHDLLARTADGIPGILVTFEGSEPDYDAVVGVITKNEAVQAFGGDALHVWFQTQTEPADPARDFRGGFLQTRTYDAKTGKRLE